MKQQQQPNNVSKLKHLDGDQQLFSGECVNNLSDEKSFVYGESCKQHRRTIMSAIKNLQTAKRAAALCCLMEFAKSIFY
jgi:hypothetical protein